VEGEPEMGRSVELSTPSQRPAIHSWQVALLTVVAVLPPAFFELCLSVPLSRRWYLLYGGAGALVLGLFLMRRPGRSLGAALAMFLLAMGMLHLVPWNSRKRFLRDLNRIKPGMSLTDVEVMMSPYVPSNSPELHPRLRTWSHSDSPAFNSDYGIVYFEQGGVVRVEFLPD
jgi:hypothetical protein